MNSYIISLRIIRYFKEETFMLIVYKLNSDCVEREKNGFMQVYNFLGDRWSPTLTYAKGFVFMNLFLMFGALYFHSYIHFIKCAFRMLGWPLNPCFKKLLALSGPKALPSIKSVSRGGKLKWSQSVRLDKWPHLLVSWAIKMGKISVVDIKWNNPHAVSGT